MGHWQSTCSSQSADSFFAISKLLEVFFFIIIQIKDNWRASRGQWWASKWRRTCCRPEWVDGGHWWRGHSAVRVWPRSRPGQNQRQRAGLRGVDVGAGTAAPDHSARRPGKARCVLGTAARRVFLRPTPAQFRRHLRLPRRRILAETSAARSQRDLPQRSMSSVWITLCTIMKLVKVICFICIVQALSMESVVY